MTATQSLEDPDSPEALSRALLNTVDSYPDPFSDLVAATPNDEILVDELADVAPLSTWSRGSTVLLGDAAHSALPFLGQGAGQAIEDALALARTLDECNDMEAAFDTYEAARKEKADRVIVASRRLGQAASLDGQITCALRNTAMRLAPAHLLHRQQREIARLSV